MKGKFKNNIIGILRKGIRRNLIECAEKWIIRDYKEYCTQHLNRRALLSYLVLPLLPPPRFRDHVKFSNRGIAQEFPRVLNELGYSVDIVNWDNKKWIPDRNYDLFIGHGGVNFEMISRRMPSSTIRMWFATGIYWREWNTRLTMRFKELEARRNIKYGSYRLVENEEDTAIEQATTIICLGNKQATNTYPKNKKIVGINNAIFPLRWEGWRSKKIVESRRHFLFFSGRGNVMKGLDLLLEAFSDTNLHLHICQHIESDFSKIYYRELVECSNIHVYGFTKMRSLKFQNLALKCNWVISPSCAEGQPGGLLECMGYGLIPIVSKETNTDVDGIGFQFESCSVENIRSMIFKVSNMKEEDIMCIMNKLSEIMNKEYTASKFRSNLRLAISSNL